MKRGLKFTCFNDEDNNYIGYLNKKGRREGPGVFSTYKTGSVIQGEWKDNELNGFAIEDNFLDGSTCKSYWKDSIQDGELRQFCGKDNSYSVEFVKGFPKGSAVFKSRKEEVYIGELRKGVRHGFGCQSYQNGNAYVG